MSSASSINDVESLLRYCVELDDLRTPVAEAVAKGARGSVASFRGDYEKAKEYNQQALAIFDKLGDRIGVADVNMSIGGDFEKTGEYAQALEHYQKALAHYEELDNRKGVARITSNIGNLHYASSEYPQALENYRRSLTMFEEIDERSGVALVTGNIGLVYQVTGNSSAALENYHRALELHEELGNRGAIANVTCYIGTVHYYSGAQALALEHYLRALAIQEELGNKLGIATTTGNLGTLYASSGDYPKALEYCYRALALHEGAGQKLGMADVLGNIAAMQLDIGDYPSALNYFHRALAIFEMLGHRTGIASTLGGIGIVYWYTGNYPVALEHYNRALTLYEELGDPRGLGIVETNIGLVYDSSGDYSVALEHLNRALTLYKANNFVGLVANVTNNLVWTNLKMGSDDNAQALLNTLDSIQIDDPNVRVECERSRAELFSRSGNHDAAVATLQHALSEAHEFGLRAKTADIHKHLRDLAQTRNDFVAYIEHNNEYTRITEEINGKDTATKLAMQAKQREIDTREREVEKQLAVLYSTLPKHIADRVIRGEVVNDHIDNAAVMFLDIVGFTTLSSALTSQQVITLLDAVFKVCDEACAQHNVTRVKTIGDSYMAVAMPSLVPTGSTFQVPGSEEEIPLVSSSRSESLQVASCIANAALQIIERIKEIDFKSLQSLQVHSISSISSSDSKQLQVRICLHCGAVTAGVLGTERLQYDVWGDTVNVASRIESTGEPNRIHISDAFAKEVAAQDMSITERGAIELKGKGIMTTYWLQKTPGA